MYLCGFEYIGNDDGDFCVCNVAMYARVCGGRGSGGCVVVEEEMSAVRVVRVVVLVVA